MEASSRVRSLPLQQSVTTYGGTAPISDPVPQSKEDHHDNQQSEVGTVHCAAFRTQGYMQNASKQGTDKASVCFEHERRWLRLVQFFWGQQKPFRRFHCHRFAVRTEFPVFAHATGMRAGVVDLQIFRS